MEVKCSRPLYRPGVKVLIISDLGKLTMHIVILSRWQCAKPRPCLSTFFCSGTRGCLTVLSGWRSMFTVHTEQARKAVEFKQRSSGPHTMTELRAEKTSPPCSWGRMLKPALPEEPSRTGPWLPTAGTSSLMEPPLASFLSGTHSSIPPLVLLGSKAKYTWILDATKTVQSNCTNSKLVKERKCNVKKISIQKNRRT